MEYTWKITGLNRSDEQINGLDDVVLEAAFSVRGVDTDGVRAEYHGAVQLAEPDANDFTAFSSLTETEVIGWVKSAVAVANIEANIAGKVTRKRNQQALTGLPW